MEIGRLPLRKVSKDTRLIT